MKKILYSIMIGLGGLFVSCSDEDELLIPHATNITFSELEISERFSHVIPDGGFTASGIRFNTVKQGNQLAAGFCYSNRSNRSFVWNNDEVSIDSMRYSVWSTKPNQTGTYLVCRVNGDDAFFTLDTPKRLSYILVANTTWNYLAMYYGDTYGTAARPVANPNVPSSPKGVWHTYVDGGVREFGEGDYLTVTAKGFLNGQLTGTVNFDLACMEGHSVENPSWDYIVTDWRKMELTALGVVDKVVFYIDSSDKDSNGIMRTPSWFCLDGFQFE
ncbi:MAG: DUF4465 domain-containing protein [Prevotella sp.]